MNRCPCAEEFHILLPSLQTVCAEVHRHFSVVGAFSPQLIEAMADAGCLVMVIYNAVKGLTKGLSFPEFNKDMCRYGDGKTCIYTALLSATEFSKFLHYLAAKTILLIALGQQTVFDRLCFEESYAYYSLYSYGEEAVAVEGQSSNNCSSHYLKLINSLAEIINWRKSSRGYTPRYNIELCSPSSCHSPSHTYSKCAHMLYEEKIEPSGGYMLPYYLTYKCRLIMQ